jgi:hypothetical protein
MTSQTKEFDCVQLQHEAQQARQKRLAHLSEDEILAYFVQLHEQLLQAKSGHAPAPYGDLVEASTRDYQNT